MVDVNEDDHPDVVVTYDDELSVPPPDYRHYEATAVRFGDGSGGFGPGRPILVPPEEVAANGQDRPRVLADATADGIVDGVIFADDGQSTVTVRPGDGTGAFGPAIVSAVPGQRLPSSLRTADVDADGSPDLVMDGACSSGPSGSESWVVGCIDVMLGDGSGGFAQPVRLTTADPEVDSLSVTIGDIDGDGNLDLVAAGWGTSFDGGQLEPAVHDRHVARSADLPDPDPVDLHLQ